jgi:hypothetical protein
LNRNSERIPRSLLHGLTSELQQIKQSILKNNLTDRNYFIVAYFFILGIACLNVLGANVSRHDEAGANKLNRRFVAVFIPFVILIYGYLTFFL